MGKQKKVAGVVLSSPANENFCFNTRARTTATVYGQSFSFNIKAEERNIPSEKFVMAWTRNAVQPLHQGISSF